MSIGWQSVTEWSEPYDDTAIYGREAGTESSILPGYIHSFVSLLDEKWTVLDESRGERSAAAGPQPTLGRTWMEGVGDSGIGGNGGEWRDPEYGGFELLLRGARDMSAFAGSVFQGLEMPVLIRIWSLSVGPLRQI